MEKQEKIKYLSGVYEKIKLIVESATYSDCVDRFNYDSSLRDLKAACIVIIFFYDTIYNFWFK
jgi:hypothetical protein